MAMPCRSPRRDGWWRGLTIFIRLLMVAVPVGVVATAFAKEVHRWDFAVTWGLVARIPLFSELSAAQIADVMKAL